MPANIAVTEVGSRIPHAVFNSVSISTPSSLCSVPQPRSSLPRIGNFEKKYDVSTQKLAEVVTAKGKTTEAQPPAGWHLRFRADGGAVNGLAWSADGRLLATAGDEAIGIWDAPAGRSLARFPANAPYARRVSWAPSGAFLAGSLCGDRVRLWDTRAAVGASLDTAR